MTLSRRGFLQGMFGTAAAMTAISVTPMVPALTPAPVLAAVGASRDPRYGLRLVRDYMSDYDAVAWRLSGLFFDEKTGAYSDQHISWVQDAGDPLRLGYATFESVPVIGEAPRGAIVPHRDDFEYAAERLLHDIRQLSGKKHPKIYAPAMPERDWIAYHIPIEGRA